VQYLWEWVGCGAPQIRSRGTSAWPSVEHVGRAAGREGGPAAVLHHRDPVAASTTAAIVESSTRPAPAPGPGTPGGAAVIRGLDPPAEALVLSWPPWRWREWLEREFAHSPTRPADVSALHPANQPRLTTLRLMVLASRKGDRAAAREAPARDAGAGRPMGRDGLRAARLTPTGPGARVPGGSHCHRGMAPSGWLRLSFRLVRCRSVRSGCVRRGLRTPGQTDREPRRTGTLRPRKCARAGPTDRASITGCHRVTERGSRRAAGGTVIARLPVPAAIPGCDGDVPVRQRTGQVSREHTRRPRPARSAGKRSATRHRPHPS
jgi:hypothetical protein